MYCTYQIVPKFYSFKNNQPKTLTTATIPFHCPIFFQFLMNQTLGKHKTQLNTHNQIYNHKYVHAFT